MKCVYKVDSKFGNKSHWDKMENSLKMINSDVQKTLKKSKSIKSDVSVIRTFSSELGESQQKYVLTESSSDMSDYEIE